MQLLLFRHGIAEPIGPDGADASRRLTQEGIEKTQQAAAGLTEIAHRLDTILTSPLIRARQTAETLGRAFDRAPIIMPDLAFGAPRAIIDQLRKRREKVVMAVGHEPTLSGIVRCLCFGRDEGNFLEMKKAGCACVEIPNESDQPGVLGEGKLLWLAPPKLLRRLAR